jgi:putative membrane protein
MSFFVGVTMCLTSFWPGVMLAGHKSIVIHMLQHILVAMMAPILIVQAKPLTLILKILPVRYARILTSFLKSPLLKFISHPFAALILNTGGMMVLYLTPLYALSLENPLLHIIVHVHLIFAGYLFVWSLIGADAVPRRPALGTRIAAAFLSIALHAFTSKFMYAYLYPRNISSSAEEVREAAKLMYYGGDLAEMIVVIILFYSWYASETTFGPSVQRSTLPLKALARC